MEDIPPHLHESYRAKKKSVAVVLIGIAILTQTVVLNGRNYRLRDLTSYSGQQNKHGWINKTTVSQSSTFTNSKSLSSQNLVNYNDTLSICLLTKDDGHILPEWLAYHYHVANLRTLIVMVDPTSKTYPNEIFDRFQNLLDIEIIEWNDNDIMPDNRLSPQGTLDAEKVADYRKQLLKPIKNKWLRQQITRKYLPKNATEQEIQDTMKLIGVHRYRQEYMATECVSHLRESGRFWVSLLDSDEYIRIGNMDEVGDNAVPDMSEEGSVMKWINRVYSNETACFKMPWYRHGATKETSDEKLSQSVPADFDPKQFMTLRWRFHNAAENNGKDCLNLQRAKSEYFPLKKITNVHALADPICGSSFNKVKLHPVTIGHYTGTWEQYSRRDDVRRSNARLDYDKKASANAIEDDDNVASWFQGFVKTHGIEKTKKLYGESYLIT